MVYNIHLMIGSDWMKENSYIDVKYCLNFDKKKILLVCHIGCPKRNKI
jgi:hypothetical protein